MQSAEWVSEKLKGMRVFLGWLAALFLIAGFAWFLSHPVRTGVVIRSINVVLRDAREVRQLAVPLVDTSIPRLKAVKAAQLGTWYSLSNSEDRAVVFSIMAEGILVPCVLFVSPRGTTAGPIPLGVHAAQVLGRLPQGLIQTYINRLLAGADLLREKK